MHISYIYTHIYVCMCDNALLICISKHIYTHSLHRILVFLWKTVGIPHPLGIHDTCKLLLFPNYCKTYSSVCRMYIHDSLRLYSPLFIAPYSMISKAFLILSTQVAGFSTRRRKQTTTKCRSSPRSPRSQWSSRSSRSR